MAPPKKNRATLPPHPSFPCAAKDTPGWALKKLDGEMFTRADIQYDLMSNIFNDRTFQFTSPLDQRAISFKELYIETLARFSKAAKSTIRQLEENPNWATNFCIASFLINIGRINTTVAFYPELRAYMRTYHPIPCLQKDEYCQTTLQDAPRIKTMLKSCQLPSELNNQPQSLPDIANRSALGFRPPTTVVNLIFELFGVEPYISMKYFPDGFVLHDLFSPTTIPTKLRAYAFLWLMHHFLEDPSAITDFQDNTKVEAFQLARLEDLKPHVTIGDSPENVDTEEEIKWGKDMQAYRLEFLKKWRGEEGIGFVDDLGTGNVAALADDAHLTKKQKIMVQNYAQAALEADEAQANQPPIIKGSAPGSSVPPPSIAVGNVKLEQRKAINKDGLGKPKSVSKARLTHVERLQGALDAMAKYGDDSDGDNPEDRLTAVELAWRRYRHDISQDVDVAYDSDDQSRLTFPAWKSKEIKNRLLGFAFPVKAPNNIVEPSEQEKKDRVIRYIGLKRRNQTSSNDKSNGKNTNVNRKAAGAVGVVKGRGKDGTTAPLSAGSVPHDSNGTRTKIKRKRRVDPLAATEPNHATLSKSASSLGLEADTRHHPAWYPHNPSHSTSFVPFE